MARCTKLVTPIIGLCLFCFKFQVQPLLTFLTLFASVVALKKVRLENEKEGFPITAVSGWQATLTS